jgi:hypothetical protein
VEKLRPQLHFDERTWQEENKPPIDLTMFYTFAHILENYLAVPQGIRYCPSLAYTGEAGSLTDTGLELGSDSFAKSRGWCFNVGLQ